MLQIGDDLIVKIIDIDYDKRRMALSVKQVEYPSSSKEEKDNNKEESIRADSKGQDEDSKEIKYAKDKPEEDSKEADNKKDLEAKSDSKASSDADSNLDKELVNITPEEKQKTIKKLLKEMKNEANID